MSQVYTINGQQGKFQIVNRGAKNHRVINIETQHSELVDVNLLTPLTNAQGPPTAVRSSWPWRSWSKSWLRVIPTVCSCVVQVAPVRPSLS